MNISEAAKQVGVTAVTLRYYEREGLVPEIRRKNGGVRDYQPEDIKWIDFIVCMRSAGLSVESLAQYTRLYNQGTSTIDERKKLLQEERKKLADKRQEIIDTLNKLDGKIQDYEDGKYGIQDTSLTSCNK
ncbi:HTH-type transcriptional regulator AdhR [Tetragenococcus halophilus subsp. flandriensis]|uniref:MerR family transcriptional regulator n=1 Tax=Tetragenococcus halophilus TaxID=51669 RepID=UPI0023E9B96E|nr:MerR family transcriptional regulator [Tetragenococcus halophilus]GMA09484.1 HTH-type transcriptional regulator AdhR [Tetragenococcus halophilus subsp. flandriensis]